MNTPLILGVDIGSVSVAVALVDADGSISRRAYACHNGKVTRTLGELVAPLGLAPDTPVAITASSPRVIDGAVPVDWLSAHIALHRASFSEHSLLLIVGGERFALVRFDEYGSYKSSRGNSSCAAGTGGFLDQQARRLGLDDAAALAGLALSNTGTRPRVASRCAVFAKTDLIHAQQEGYTHAEICDGLCEGLARNLGDALVTGALPDSPVIMTGGVARNAAVVGHLERHLDRKIEVPAFAREFAAAGAALELAGQLERNPGEQSGRSSRPAHVFADRINVDASERSYHYAPLVEPTDYPDFSAHRQFRHTAVETGGMLVEVDDYRSRADDESPAARTHARTEPLYLGVDIGSTSTKAVLAAADGSPWWAFYTRTAGTPLVAVRAILETIDNLDAVDEVAGVATTGSGRKFVGGVLGADLILDEITAHARAAVSIDDGIDTIIEIGGQDAKFTTLRDGRVTFSQMNSVCAAGTGSFIEEQASRLQVPVGEYANRCIGTPAPLTSDRCTVFMERDINHYLNNGYTNDEILTAALHSVRENYLQKVAERSAIGTRVCFQGATAKNRALVAAFEMELGRPVLVSRYCHVTGALGAALTCIDEGVEESTFRGIHLWREEIPVRSERCSLCTNHCRLRVATVGNEEVAFGFLCGRDYATASFVSSNKSGFSLLSARRRVERSVARRGGLGSGAQNGVAGLLAQMGRRAGTVVDAVSQFVDGVFPGGTEPAAPVAPPVIGIPAGLHLADEHAYFQRVFAELGIPTRTSAGLDSPVARGKQMQGAEFCSPVSAFHAHVAEMLEQAEYVFVPVMLERADNGNRRRSYCYYTQFSSAMILGAVAPEDRQRVITPVLYGDGVDPAAELQRALTPHCAVSVSQVREAMRIARAALEAGRAELQQIYQEKKRGPEEEEIDVVLLGRPYTALDPSMNNAIPEIFERNGVRPFFQDMLPTQLPSAETERLLQGIHWRYAAEILLAADKASRTPGLYPVLITSFKCAPDSFCQDAFKRIMDAREKPYLILQLDEHDSNVGYETRIEAAIRAFRNHHATARTARNDLRWASNALRPIAPRLERMVKDRTVLLPNWDPITTPLLAANLRGHGIDAVTLTETADSIQQSMRMNSGQCIPVSAIAQEAMDHVRSSGRTAESFVLWMIEGDWACGIPLYPGFVKSLFQQEGLGSIGVYVGDISYMDMAPAAVIGAYFAYQFGGWLRRISCSIRPYELEQGRTDAVVAGALRRLTTVLEQRGNRARWLRRTVREFRAIPIERTHRPKVAIFGDLYVRDNDVMNQGLIRTIEEAGGEAVTTPYSDYVKIIAGSAFDRMRRRGEYANIARFRFVMAAIERLERRYVKEVEEFLGPSISWRDLNNRRELARFGIVDEQEGETYDNALKILHLLAHHDDISLFVQASPAFCCPSLVTESISGSIESVTGVPIVTITYDGTGSNKNAAVIPYVRFARERQPA